MDDRQITRTILTIGLIVCMTSLTIAQNNVNPRQMVGFGCYYEGRLTKVVSKVSHLLEDKNYKAISRLLTSGNKGEKYLAVISLQRLEETGQYKINDKEKDLILKLKASDDLVSVCSGCTYFDKVQMKTMLADKDFIGSSSWLDWALRE